MLGTLSDKRKVDGTTMKTKLRLMLEQSKRDITYWKDMRNTVNSHIEDKLLMIKQYESWIDVISHDIHKQNRAHCESLRSLLQAVEYEWIKGGHATGHYQPAMMGFKDIKRMDMKHT
jgi:hypothetical protein